MLERFYPDYEAESAYEIDYQGLYQMGCRGIIFDIDNTLVPHGARRINAPWLCLLHCAGWDIPPCCSPTTGSPG